MALLGVRASVDLVTPTGVDAKKVFEFQVLRDTMTAGELLSDAAAIIGRVNEELFAQYSNVISMTDSMYGITAQGQTTRTMTPEATEWTPADAVRTDEIGHMLPLKKYDDATGWTEDYLLDGRRSQITRDLQLISERWRNRFDFQFITRILTDTENAIGTAGYDVGWAIGTGDNVNYIPPQWRGNVFDTTHSHYVFKDDTPDDYDDLFEEMVKQLRHHGYGGRLLALTSEADLDEIMALANFVRLKPSEVTYVAGNTSAPIRFAQGEFEGVPGELYGYYESKRGLVELRFHERIPTNYAWMTRPFGPDNANNGVALRVHPAVPFGLAIDPILSKSAQPKLEMVMFNARFGIGVNNRLNGVAGYINAGAASYVNPTIT